MKTRVLAKCEGCQREIVLAQEEAQSMAHLSIPEFETFLRDHEGCRAKVAGRPYITWHAEEGE
jgi:hypothetical protein